ncbi:MAG: precorrin-8X methylmutase [Deltaproteobacteria bacterium]
MTIASDVKTAVLLLGHGSKAPGANETLIRVAEAVRLSGGYADVVPAFLQMASPDVQGGIDILVEKGYTDIVIMPYFLYMGLHVSKDLPAEIAEAKKRHPALTFTFAGNLDYHEKLIDVTIERIEEAFSCRKDRKEMIASSPYAQHPIEKESFRILSEEMDGSAFSPAELPVVHRVVHTTADFEYPALMRFSPGAVEAGIEALKGGCRVITDVKMVEAGITRGRLSPFGAEVLCFSADADVIRDSVASGSTRTAASMRKAARSMEGAIVVIGNAPTALKELLRLRKGGAPKPALIVGVPVGFVGAEDSKEELIRSGAPFITVVGRKGGSTVAAAIVNAIAIEAGSIVFG